MKNRFNEDISGAAQPAAPDRDDELFVFDESEPVEESPADRGYWNILIVDDEPGVHQVTELALKRVTFEGRRLRFIHAYSAAQACDMMAREVDIALVLLDVIMETVNAGLEVAEYIRHELNNPTTRIILRTGQSGTVVERDVITRYEIDGYRTKTELTADKLYTLVLASLRSYRDLVLVGEHNKSLAWAVSAISTIYSQSGDEPFVTGLLEQLQAGLRFSTPTGLPDSCWAAEYQDEQLKLIQGRAPWLGDAECMLEKIMPVELLSCVRDCLWHQRVRLEDGNLILVVTHEPGPALVVMLSDVLPLTESEKHLMDIFEHALVSAYRNLRLGQENERQRQALSQRVALRTAELSDAQAKLLHSEKLASVGQLAAGVAHEINNPIGFIKSNLGSMQRSVDLLLSGFAALPAIAADDPRWQARIDALLQELDFAFVGEDLQAMIRENLDGVDRVARIVQSLKSFSRVDDGEAFAPADLHEIVENSVSIVWNELKYKVELHRQYAELPPVHCAASRISQVLVNLLVNAGQAIEKRGEITLTTHRDGDYVGICVRDNGCGMSEAQRQRIFEPFFTTKPVGTGTGLGLSVSFGIAEDHGGYIEVESGPEQGSAFTLVLPIQPVTPCASGPRPGIR